MCAHVLVVFIAVFSLSVLLYEYLFYVNDLTDVVAIELWRFTLVESQEHIYRYCTQLYSSCIYV